jgi:hypothetical protein
LHFTCFDFLRQNSQNLMKVKILLFLVLTLTLPALCQTTPLQGKVLANRQFEIQINKNVELLGLVYFLGYEGAQAKMDEYSARKRPVTPTAWICTGNTKTSKKASTWL